MRTLIDKPGSHFGAQSTPYTSEGVMRFTFPPRTFFALGTLNLELFGSNNGNIHNAPIAEGP